jgi:hypothetical protein
VHASTLEVLDMRGMVDELLPQGLRVPEVRTHLGGVSFSSTTSSASPTESANSTSRSGSIPSSRLAIGWGTRAPKGIPVPAGFRFQPVDAGDVAARLVEFTLGEPVGLVPDMGGLRVYGAAELLRGYLRATQRRRLIVPLWLPGKAAREFRAGANLALEQAAGHRPWEEFRAENLTQRRPTPRVGTTSASV